MSSDEQAAHEHAKIIATEHWSYVEASIMVTDPDMPERYLAQMKFHYISSGVHFHKHGRRYKEKQEAE